MKKGQCSRSKPPPVRASYMNAKSRNHLSVERPFFYSPQPSSLAERRCSMSDNPDIREALASITALHVSSKEVKDCMSGWLTFIQMLKGVCSAGAQLSQCLGLVASSGDACRERAIQCQAMWDQLLSATNAAAAVVKSQAVAVLQEAHVAADIDADQADINQQVVCSSLVTLVNLQYQFSAACCECMAGLAECQCYPPHTEPDCDGVARCYVAKLPPLLQPPQRRWSEAAARPNTADTALRRWSVPWKLAMPAAATTNVDRSRSTTPETVWHTALASQEELQDVITLLSCKPSPPQNNTPQHLPGVTLTRCEPGHTEHLPRLSIHRGSWWGEGEDLDPTTLASRKSSSSTDSSSCYSIHSRSTSGSEELTYGQRSHLYSMWSGADIPFINLPESSENNDM